MGVLTEVEIIDCLMDQLHMAAQAADDIAVRPKKGRTYEGLRGALGNAEGACRQLAHWRGDWRWLKVGMVLHEAHRRSGEWLRGVKVKGFTRSATRLALPMSEKHPLFVKLAESLRHMREQAGKLKNEATGVIGPVLPTPPSISRRVGAPIAVSLPAGMHRLDSGLIVPQGAAAQ